jgi:2,3-oxidosqualene cyclase
VSRETSNADAARPVELRQVHPNAAPPETVGALGKAIAHLSSLQRADGSFEGEVVWCPMILAQYVMLRAFLQRPIPQHERVRMIRHFECTRRPEGGWGLHAESSSYVFVTVLSYVALRLLGVGADAPLTSTARRWLHAQPSGVLSVPSWGKFWLAMAGLYGYEGVNPFPPEIFLLPRRSPVHPNQLYCHTRYIYLAICFLYGSRFRANLGPIAPALRQELYPEPFETIDFSAHRHDLAATDVYVQPGRALRVAWNVMSVFERLVPKLAPLRALRRRALARCLARICYEQDASRFQGVSPVNGMLNAIALYVQDPRHPMLEPSLAGIESWRWDDDEEGIRFAGARSTSWDTAFATLAMLAGPSDSRASVRRAYAYLDAAQEKGELADGEHEARLAIRGGWCFSDGHHRWPVSDCAAEALSAMLMAHAKEILDGTQQIPAERIEAAVRFVLDRQNDDGGFGTYERRRGPHFLERLNPSEMFGDCMTELSYIECTASAVIALCHFREHYPDRLGGQTNDAIAKGCAVLRARQRADGSWPGFWGINFTYATWFAMSALRTAGAQRSDPALRRGAQWLIERQKPDGGWGEHYSSCLNATYVEHPRSQAVMTSWALLALLECVDPQAESVRLGVAWLCHAQRADGSWPEDAVNGVFFGSAMLLYRMYPTYFPLWALNRYCAIAGHD